MTEVRATGVGFFDRLRIFCEAIKISHSVFALPFAVSAAFLAAGGAPPLPLLGKVIAAVVLARTAAMTFNRWVDAEIDARNPRTMSRAVPRGLLSRRFMAVACVLTSALFIAASAWINFLAFLLSPICLAVLLGYSLTKRFTSFSHLVLGAALGLSPLGAWVAIREELALPPLLLGLAVLAWTAGFDIIYACQDADFDTRSGLHSLPGRLGVARALLVSRGLHVVAVALLGSLGLLAGSGFPYWLGVAGVGAILTYEQSLVSPADLSRVDLAFFTLNGFVSLAFMTSVIADTLI